jgi:hypothetical protein
VLQVSPSRERLLLRTCGVFSAFLLYELLLSCDLEPIGSSIVAVIGGFMAWVAARAALVRWRRRDDDWAQP